jgi:hypothetical protein
MIIMTILLFLVSLEPIDTIPLKKEFNRIEIYRSAIYCAPFIGKSIFVLDESQNLKPITFTDDVNYRIYDFFITPFAIYLNNGRSIDKFYLASGVKENSYSSTDINTFVITPSEEIIFSDRQKHELIFLDFTNNIKFKKVDLKIDDLYSIENTIYILTKNNVLICDEYGNVIEEKEIPEKLNRIVVDSTSVIIFSPYEKYLYKLNENWEKIEFSHDILDITANDEIIVILSENGTALYIYSKSNF